MGQSARAQVIACLLGQPLSLHGEFFGGSAPVPLAFNNRCSMPYDPIKPSQDENAVE